METIPLRADDKCAKTGLTGSELQRASGPCLLVTPAARLTSGIERSGTEAGRAQRPFVLAGGVKWMVVQRALLYWCQGRRLFF